MSDKLYEVIYIDKFSDEAEASVVRQRLKERFKLSDRMVDGLSSGVPIIVKKDVSLEEAERFDAAIKELGGVCWVQPMAFDKTYHDRRDLQRRETADRRERHRGSSILPDRRMGMGRRSTDNQF